MLSISSPYLANAFLSEARGGAIFRKRYRLAPTADSLSSAFYEFFTEGHHTRFYMTLKRTPLQKFLEKIGFNVDSKAFSEFYSLQKKLNSFGYSAIDLR